MAMDVCKSMQFDRKTSDTRLRMRTNGTPATFILFSLSILYLRLKTIWNRMIGMQTFYEATNDVERKMAPSSVMDNDQEDSLLQVERVLQDIVRCIVLS